MNKTAIQWTDFSSNPLKYRRKSDGKVMWGCVKISEGCAHCYAEALALRFHRGKLFNTRNMEELEPFLDETEMRKMLTVKTIGGVPVSGSRCFLADMTDLFGAWVPDDLLNQLFSSVLEIRTDVTWQLLTKRAKRMHDYLSCRWGEGRIPCRNIHVGVSVENQQQAAERIPHLLRTPAATRFVSCEPLLGEINLDANQLGVCPWHDDLWIPLDWVITGCESGPRRRECLPEWDMDIQRQCEAAGVAFFRKQMIVNGRVSHDPAEWPEVMRVRQFPEEVQS